ncbi:DNA-binding response regulator, OmpR family, contains REC and winged-helix (wHTH) domain [Variovorax sp. YR266]|uniref:response regulator n=1 Tax=Variovorax sp. YR266 TaxID=1884386 RepID=UPI00089D31BD|nr:response regulator [Variovorax sp. YR266]SDY36088.1 DNA-binding response regulator, OmpR family, contains REC and winged-helix (wHTH) domain [Variovorax sp. YR266]
MRKVLIVEDDVSTNDRLKALVESVPDTEVIQAFDKVGAEEAMRLHTLALMVIDVRLGEGPKDKLSGLTLLNTLNGKPTVAIVVSGMPYDMLQDFAISLQAFEFINKPINELDFINKVERALVFHKQLLADLPAPQASGWPAGLEPDAKRKLHFRWKGRPVMLSITEMRLVHCLIEPPNTVVEYAKLGQQLLTATSRKAVNTAMTGVRNGFIDVDPNFDAIDSEPGKGYIWRTGHS